MTRVGFKKVYSPGTFDNAALQALFGHISNTVIDAEFDLILNTTSAIDFIQYNGTPVPANDDVPHWAFEYQDNGSSGSLFAYAVHGSNFQDSAAYKRQIEVFNSAFSPAEEITVWFCADGIAGWWWLHAVKTNPASETGVQRLFAYAGTTSRRYPSDYHQGLCARYGIRGAEGLWLPPYALSVAGQVNEAPILKLWSPFGLGNVSNTRHPGSPMPRMAVPQFPCPDSDISACILGEFNEIFALTNGYASEEIVMPGWVAMIGDETEPHYAVPAPDQFDLL